MHYDCNVDDFLCSRVHRTVSGDKTWVTNDVLTAADLNGYVRDQWITVCTSATRPASPVNGRRIYETDTGFGKIYNSTSATWVDLGPTHKGYAGRNQIINGNLSVSQRGNGPFTTTNTYGSDMVWNNSAGSTFSNTRTALALGAIPGVAEAGYCYSSVVTSVAGAGNFVAVQFPIEGVHTFAGKTVVVSFYAQTTGASKPVAVELQQQFGTGGSPSAEVDTFVGKPTITTSWARYSYTVAVPSISGKTVGSAGNDYLRLAVWFDAGTTYAARTSSLGQQSGTFNLWGVQVEEGSAATAFEDERPSVTLAKCQRYLVTPTAASRVPGHCLSAVRGVFQWAFPVQMRSTPAVTIPAVAGFSALDATGGSVVATTAATLVSNPNEVVLDMGFAGGMVAGNASFLTIPGGLYLSAEL